MNIVYGTKLFAGQPYNYCKVAKKLGFEADFYNYPSNRFGYHQGQLLSGSFRSRRRIFDELLERQPDAVHFWQSGLLSPYVGDRSLLKEYESYLSAGIKVYHRFTGFDLRLPHWDLKNNEYSVYRYGHEWPFSKHVDIERYEQFLQDLFSISDIEFCVGDSELGRFLPNEFTLTPRIFIGDDDGKVLFERGREDTTLRILHAPSNSVVKGTDFVVSAVESLKSSGFDVELELLQGVPHKEVVAAIKRSDLLIDQLHIGAPGVFTLEGWRYGKPVGCYFNYDVLGDYGGDSPVLNMNPNSIESVLRRVLSDRQELKDIAYRGHEVYQQNHSAKMVERKIETLYKDNKTKSSKVKNHFRSELSAASIKNTVANNVLDISVPDKLDWLRIRSMVGRKIGTMISNVKTIIKARVWRG